MWIYFAPWLMEKFRYVRIFSFIAPHCWIIQRCYSAPISARHKMDLFTPNCSFVKKLSIYLDRSKRKWKFFSLFELMCREKNLNSAPSPRQSWTLKFNTVSKKRTGHRTGSKENYNRTGLHSNRILYRREGGDWRWRRGDVEEVVAEGVAKEMAPGIWIWKQKEW